MIQILKIGFSIINGLLECLALFLLYILLVKISNDQNLAIFSSVIQILANLVLIPLLQPLVMVATPLALALAISSNIIPGIDNNSVKKITDSMFCIPLILLLISFNIAIQAFFAKNIKKFEKE